MLSNFYFSAKYTKFKTAHLAAGQDERQIIRIPGVRFAGS